MDPPHQPPSFADVLQRRRMVRNFADREVSAEQISALVDRARRAPSAGNTAATEFLVLHGPEQTDRYWDTTLTGERRSAFPWPGLLKAPVLVIPLADPEAYLNRYDEPDKAHTGLGESTEGWAVPYWDVDTGFATMVLLLAVVEAGLGACFFGQFEHTEKVKQAFGVPPHLRPVGTVALGYPAEDRRSLSSRRPRPPVDEIIHWGSYRSG